MSGFISGLDPNVATLLSGAMSMIGGAIGAAGAYWVANTQIKKQFLKQDKDRVLELRIEMINNSLVICHDILHELNKIKGRMYDIEIKMKEILDNDWSSINGKNISVDKLNEISKQVKVVNFYKDTIKKHKIFIPESFDLTTLFSQILDYCESQKNYLSIFEKLPDSIVVSSFKEDYTDILQTKDDAHNTLAKTLEKDIDTLEKELKTLLKISN